MVKTLLTMRSKHELLECISSRAKLKRSMKISKKNTTDSYEDNDEDDFPLVDAAPFEFNLQGVFNEQHDTYYHTLPGLDYQLSSLFGE